MIEFNSSLANFSGLLFLTTTRVGWFDEAFMTRMTLVVLFGVLDQAKRKTIWDNLQKELISKHTPQIRLNPSARKFLDNDEMHNIDWTGHEIVRCFQTAIALAEFKAKKELLHDSRKEIVIEVEYLKEALNKAYSFRAYMNSVSGTESSRRARSFGIRNDWFSLRENPDVPSALEHNPIIVRQRKRRDVITSAFPKPSLNPNQLAITLDSETDVCIPDLNRVGWEKFKAAGSGQLFRNTKFHAIDVLVGEPVIKLDVGNKGWQNHKAKVRRGVVQNNLEHTKNQEIQATTSLSPGEIPLPERIRINSLAIRKIFEDIHGDGECEDFVGPFLIFRPFRSLIYYEQEFKEWATRQETMIPGEQSNVMTNIMMQETEKVVDPLS